jgi:hypothetical protein
MTKSTSKETKEIWDKRILAQEQSGFSKHSLLFDKKAFPQIGDGKEKST